MGFAKCLHHIFSSFYLGPVSKTKLKQKHLFIGMASLSYSSFLVCDKRAKGDEDEYGKLEDLDGNSVYDSAHLPPFSPNNMSMY